MSQEGTSLFASQLTPYPHIPKSKKTVNIYMNRAKWLFHANTPD